MSAIVMLPALIALFVALRYGTGKALLNVYLPVMLLIPPYYQMTFTPHQGFAEMAILPIGVLYLIQPGEKWRWSFCDLLVIAYVLIVGMAEYLDSDYSMAQNVAIFEIASFLLPYVLAKGLLQREEMGVAFAKRLMVLITVIVIVSVFEFRMGRDLFQNLPSYFFPGQGVNSVGVYRNGHRRIAGPFPHALIMALALLMCYRIARWLEWSGNWTEKIAWLRMSKARFCALVMLAGLAMTFSRQAWVATAAGAVVVGICRAKKRLRALILVLVILVVVVPPTYTALKSYMGQDRSSGMSEEQDSATYRYEMFQQYIDIAAQRLDFGWGLNGFPIIHGMSSIDDHFLLLALTYGIYATALVVALLLWTPIRLIKYGIRRPRDDPGGMLAASLAGLYLVLIISLTTVWLGGQAQPLWLLFAGWGEGLLATPQYFAKTRAAMPKIVLPFRRVMV